MKTRTLSMFCEENGVNFVDLSESIGVSIDELENVKDFYFVPVDLADKIVKVYSLPDNYFNEDAEAPEKYNLWHFMKLSIGWDFLTSIPLGVAVLVAMIAALFITGKENVDTFIKVFSLIIAVAGFAIAVASCVLLERYYKKRNENIGDFGKYKFLFFIIPTNLMLIMNLGALFSTGSEFILIFILKNVIIPIIILFLGALFTGLLMEASQCDNLNKRTITKNVLAIISCFSLIIFSFIPDVSDAFDSIIIKIVKITLCIIMTLGITIGDKLKPNLSKLWYTVLPLIYLVINFFTIPVNLF